MANGPQRQEKKMSARIAKILLAKILSAAFLAAASFAGTFAAVPDICQAEWHWVSPTVVWVSCTNACDLSCDMDTGSSGGDGWASCACPAPALAHAAPCYAVFLWDGPVTFDPDAGVAPINPSELRCDRISCEYPGNKCPVSDPPTAGNPFPEMCPCTPTP